jgi:hypothetical protein
MHFGERHSQLLPFCEYVFAPGESPVEMQPEILDIFLLRKVHAAYVPWRGQVSLRVVNVTRTYLDTLASILHPFNHLRVPSRLVCSSCEAMSGSLSVATTAATSANVAAVGSGVFGRSAVYSRYNSGS